MAVHGGDELSAEEVVKTDVLVGAGRGQVRTRPVQLDPDESAL